jgi:SAM-dependent methyltransferase
MHDTAMEVGRIFFEEYLNVPGPNNWKILDVGASDVCGSLRSVCPSGARYIGVDIAPGEGVDVVLSDSCQLPFPAEEFDAVVCTSCLEHAEFFWVLFEEIVRVTKQKGLIYINAPSNGDYHAYPTDAWRFYPDSAVALRKWASRLGYNISVLESFIAPRKRDVWNDCVMIFGKAPIVAKRGSVVSRVPGASNIRTLECGEALLNFQVKTEDQRIISALQNWLVVPRILRALRRRRESP